VSGGDAQSQQSSSSLVPRIGASLDESTASVRSSNTNLPFSGKKGKKKGKKKVKKILKNPDTGPSPLAPTESSLLESLQAENKVPDVI
jgi:hypothetical protein